MPPPAYSQRAYLPLGIFRSAERALQPGRAIPIGPLPNSPVGRNTNCPAVKQNIHNSAHPSDQKYYRPSP